MAYARAKHCSVKLNYETILIYGGITEFKYNLTDRVEIYNMAKNEWILVQLIMMYFNNFRIHQ